jgi:predicted TPR repeat methyltransferase
MDLLHATATPYDLTRAAEALVLAGRVGAARPMLAALRRMAPADPRTAILAVRLAIREGQPASVLVEIDAAIDAAPADPALRKCRAELRLLLGDRAGAAGDAAEAVLHDRADPAAKAMLGVMLLELGRPADALACLAEAVAAEPANPAFRQAVAAAQEAAGDPDAAAATFAAAIAAVPGRVGLRTGALLLAIRRRRFADAVALAQAARRDGIADACVFGLLGHALSSQGRHDEASDAYAEALKLGPEDPYVRHLVSASGMMPPAGQAPLAYLRAVFDGCADTFEKRLLGLRYRIPGLVRAALLRHLDLDPDPDHRHPATGGPAGPPVGPPVGPVLDLGCGTGLLAVVLSDLPLGPLTGIDASPRMLAHAADKGLYAELVEADMIDTLTRDTGRWRIMLAADVLCYLGPLEPLFAAAAARLEPGGLFVFSAETPTGAHATVAGAHPGWVLGRLGRYAHDPAYVAAAAANSGFVVRECRPETIRTEAGAPVAGLLAVLQRPAARDVH